ncbi:MAG: pyruvate dehydrogenase complex dihydrolipoamide acetyltransferase [Leptospiraceae bacterium]|nr:pyruvate dehydrogenase complex dihydrolipoamide acetyltransferase [Leptospiraceae bacterium]
MAKIAEMTQLSPTMSEGTIVKWIKLPGDSMEPGEVIAEVETDKAVMEMEAYDKTTLLAIVAENGTKVKVGLPIAIFGKPGEDFSALLAEAKSKLLSSAAVAIPEPPKATESKPVETKPVVVVEQKKEVVVAPKVEQLSKPNRNGRLFASPLAKSIALEKGIDINLVNGTGPEGRVTKQDVLNYISTGGNIIVSRKSKKQDNRIELTGMRKVIAERLVSSKQNVPHFYLNLEFDAEPILEMRKSINAQLKLSAEKKKETPVSISVNDFLVKAIAKTLEEYPSVNSSFRGDHILELGSIDIGIAVSLEGGLITPYVRNANEKSILEISTEIKSLAKRARDRKLKPEEYSGGSFTISNLGMFGITSFSAIINEPESCILAVGTVIEKPVIKNGEIKKGSTMTVTLSCDHRVVDGALGAAFLAEFKTIVENPGLMLV